MRSKWVRVGGRGGQISFNPGRALKMTQDREKDGGEREGGERGEGRGMEEWRNRRKME